MAANNNDDDDDNGTFVEHHNAVAATIIYCYLFNWPIFPDLEILLNLLIPFNFKWNNKI